MTSEIGDLSKYSPAGADVIGAERSHSSTGVVVEGGWKQYLGAGLYRGCDKIRNFCVWSGMTN